MRFQNALPRSVVETVNKLIAILSQASQDGKKFAVVSHANDDFDSLASIAATRILLASCINAQAKVFFDYPSEESSIIKRDGGLSDLRDYITTYGQKVFIILVDANDMNAFNVNERGLEDPLPQADVVIDHHSAGLRTKEPQFEIRSESATSAISLLLEIIEVACAKKSGLFKSEEFATLATLAIRAMSNDVGRDVSEVKADCKVLGPRAKRYWHKLLKLINLELYACLPTVDPRFAKMRDFGLLVVNQKKIGNIYGYFLGVHEKNDLSKPMARFADEQTRKLPKGSIVLALAYVKEGNYIRLVLRKNQARTDLAKVVQQICPNNGGGRADAAVGRTADPYYNIWKSFAPYMSIGSVTDFAAIDTFDEPTWFANTALADYVDKVARLKK